MNTVGMYFTLRYSCQLEYSNTVQDKGTSIPPSTERLSSTPFPLQHQPSLGTNRTYLPLPSRVTVKKLLRENPSGLPVGLGVEEWMEDEEGEEEMGEKEMGAKDV